MTDRAAQVREVLASLVDGRHRLGAALVSRDGIVAASRMARPVSEETFAAMAAAMLGAAEGAMAEWADDRPRRATVEGSRLRVQAQAIDDAFFLATASPAGAEGVAPAIEVDAAVARLRTLLRPQVVAP